jgi:ribonuclease J
MGTIAYTGDMRTHGPKGDMTEDFVDAACEAEPIAFITEGTRMEVKSKRRNLTEAQVACGVSEVVEEADRSDRMVIYSHGPRDMDRLRTFHTTAGEHGRCIVISTRTAYLLSRLREDIHLDLPDPLKDDAVCVYFRRKKSGEYDERDYYKWERPFLDKIVTYEDLKKDPEQYMINLNFSSFAELIDIRPDVGTPYILSMSEPFTEEDLGIRIFQNWLNHFALVYHQLHASGHIGKAELADAIERINPRTLFPVHTEHPEMFHEVSSSVIEPVKSKEYLLR